MKIETTLKTRQVSYEALFNQLDSGKTGIITLANFSSGL